jgi:hypothetical protein
MADHQPKRPRRANPDPILESVMQRRSNSEFSFSGHCRTRQLQRRIGDDEIEFALLFGTRCRIPGAEARFVRRKDIPDGLDEKFRKQVSALAVIVSTADKCVVTAYRSETFLSDIKRKRKWN